MGFSLKNTFENICRKFSYRLELSTIFLSAPVEEELKAKGWQIDYDLPPALVVASVCPCLPILTIKDRNGVAINEPGNDASRDQFYADLREAAARRWLQKPPATTRGSRQPN